MRNNRKVQRKINILRKEANAAGVRTKAYRIYKGTILLPFSFHTMLDAIRAVSTAPRTRIIRSTNGGVPAPLTCALPSGMSETALLPLPREEDPDRTSLLERVMDTYLKMIKSGPLQSDTVRGRVGPDKASFTA